MIKVNQYNQLGGILFKLQCMSSLHEKRRSSDDISTYIKKELSTILKQVHETPPKKSSSLKNIQKLVQESSISIVQKQQISKSIKRVQSAINTSTSIQKIKSKMKNQSQSSNKYQKQLFYENMILEEKQLNLNKGTTGFSMVSTYQKKGKQSKSDNLINSNRKKNIQFLNLVETFEQLRTYRLKYQHEIQNLSIKAQKLQRLIQIKRQNQEKYLQSVHISSKYQQKKSELQGIKAEVKTAVRENRKKMVSVLMKKYNQLHETNEF